MKRNLSDCQSLLPLLRALFCLFLFLGAVSPAHAFYNPVVSSGQDPSVVFVNGYYYLAQTGPGNSIVVIKSSTLTSIASGTRTQVWTAPAGAYCCEIWAPEIQYINNRFYIYFAADDGNNANHRMYVIESNGADAQGAYTFRGKLTPPTDRWAIDGSVLQRGSQLYFIWSGWDGTVNDAQHLFIAPMSNPYTISGERVKISSPDQAWERVVGNPFINEGPEALLRNGKMFIVYSANGSWADQYCLGMLTASDTANPLLKASWTKSSSCVFSQRDTAYGPGHNSFTKSPNGAEDWIVYHANLTSGSGWGGRSVRAQKFTWNSSGNPVFGTPASRNDDLAQPAGEAPLPAPTQWEASNVAGNFIRHYAGRVRLDPNVNPVQDSQWRMVPGLSNSTGVSFQSVNFPGNYLRHRNGEVWAEAIDGSAGFRADATFFRRTGLANSAYASFEASNFAGSYLRHRGGLFYSEGVADAVGRSDATFIQRGGVSVGVIFYQDINYGGTASALLGKGDYGSLPASVPNDWMSSLRVPAGWAVDAYENGNFTGAICTFAADTAWVGTACNDKMSSFRIR